MSTRKSAAGAAVRDRSKPRRHLLIPLRIGTQLLILAERNVTNPTQEAVRAVREYLERNGLWPPNADGVA